MGSLLVWAAFGERVVGILVWQSGKRSSENGVQTTFGVGGGKGSSLERPRAYRTHPTDGFCGIAGRVCTQRHACGCRLRLAVTM